MYLKKIIINNFKNIASQELEFSQGINCISGNNGEGKTNLLDAVYCLSMTKSYFHFPDSFSILHGAETSTLNGNYLMDDGTENSIGIKMSAKVKRDGTASSSAVLDEKTVKKNGKAYDRISEHIGLLPVVMVSPSDVALVNGSGDERRKFVNALLSQTDKDYLVKVQNYRRLLAQRNRYLKQLDGESAANAGYFMDSINKKLSENASYIYDKRKELCENLSGPVTDCYRKLSGGCECVRLRYVSDLDGGPLTELLAKYFDRDKFLKFTTVGVHKDDFAFEIADKAADPDDDAAFYPIKRCGSQGQQKCFLVALKLAQFDIMKKLNGGTSPILLLDDVFDKLDMQRVEYLFGVVSGNAFGQIFVTDSNKVRMANLIAKIGKECKEFEISGGKTV